MPTRRTRRPDPGADTTPLRLPARRAARSRSAGPRAGLRHVPAVAGGGALLALLPAAPASAHERWFAEPADGGDWGFLLSPLPLAATAAVVVVTVLWRLAARRLPRPELGVLRPLGRLAPFVPRLLGIHLGVSLLAFSVTGSFLTPALPLEDVPGGDLAGLAEAAVGIWLITGIRLRVAALGVVLLGPPALLAAGPVALLETAGVLGIAVFLAVLPPSDLTFGRVDADPRRLRAALLGLRVLVSVSLVTLALSEKFTNPQLARNTLAEYPELNVPALVGLPVPTDVFIVTAGAVELLFGLLVLSGAMPQVAVLVAAVPFNATLVLFGTTEVIGHLPVYGVFLTLLVYGSRRETAAEVPWLPSVREVLTAARRVATLGRATAAPDSA